MMGTIYHTIPARDCFERLTKHEVKSLKYERNPAGYKVLYDPDPIAGFSKGATITKEQHIEMLRMNCYTPGTIIKGADGKIWRVIQHVKNQGLKRCPNAWIPTRPIIKT
jgi:hypothetical protein